MKTWMSYMQKVRQKIIEDLVSLFRVKFNKKQPYKFVLKNIQSIAINNQVGCKTLKHYGSNECSAF